MKDCKHYSLHLYNDRGERYQHASIEIIPSRFKNPEYKWLEFFIPVGPFTVSELRVVDEDGNDTEGCVKLDRHYKLNAGDWFNLDLDSSLDSGKATRELFSEIPPTELDEMIVMFERLEKAQQAYRKERRKVS